jgi:YD repeat-containing protein
VADYLYNDANQRTRRTSVDDSYWRYEYDSLGQVVSGKRYWSDGTLVAGQQFEYGFDDIGNRTFTKAGGDASGANPRTAGYTANSLNQYTQREVPGAVDVTGVALVTNTVTVDGVTAYRKGEYFWREVPVTNSSSAAWQGITVSSGGSNVTGNVFLPKTPETFVYDADGNVTNDGRWTFMWDGDNRLVQMTSLTNTPSGSRKSLKFSYDWQGRRISKVVSNWTGSAWSMVASNKFVYDGWNLVAELNGTNGLVRSYLWGTDLSGSPLLGGAGGGLQGAGSRPEIGCQG